MTGIRVSTALGVFALIASASLAWNIEGQFGVDRWAGEEASGPIFTPPIITPALQFDYALAGGSTLDDTTVEVTATAPATTTVTFSYDYRGNHRFFVASAGLQVFADGSGGTTTVDLVPFNFGNVSGNFQFVGRATIDVEAGFDWGVRARAFNGDSNGNGEGSIVLYNFSELFEGDYDRAMWATAANPGFSVVPTLGLQDAVELRYDSDLSTVNVSPACNGAGEYDEEHFDLLNYACGGDRATFNWSYDFFHQFFNDEALIHLVTDKGGSRTVTLLDSRCDLREIMTGTATVETEDGELFGVEVGGTNGNAGAHITGAVVLWNLRTFTACEADLTTQGAPVGDPNYGVPDGTVSAADIQYYVNLYSAGCP